MHTRTRFLFAPATACMFEDRITGLNKIQFRASRKTHGARGAMGAVARAVRRVLDAQA